MRWIHLYSLELEGVEHLLVRRPELGVARLGALRRERDEERAVEDREERAQPPLRRAELLMLPGARRRREAPWSVPASCERPA